MQIDDEKTEGTTIGFVRWGIVVLCAVLLVFFTIGIVQSYRGSARMTEAPVVDDLRPTVWKGEYILPLPSVAVNILPVKEDHPILHVSIALVLSQRSDIKEAQNAMPLIRESIILLARGLSVRDVQSPEALYRLKQALLKRVQWVLDPIVVQDVLISELFMDNMCGGS